MIGHATRSFSYDWDGEHQFDLPIWIAETQSSNLLGIEFCRQYVSKLHFEIPAIELKNTAKVICYGNMCSTKPYPFVSKIHTIRTPHHIHIDAKTSRVGHIHRKINQKTSRQELPLFLIDTRSNQDQILLMYYALNLKAIYPS